MSTRWKPSRFLRSRIFSVSGKILRKTRIFVSHKLVRALTRLGFSFPSSSLAHHVSLREICHLPRRKRDEEHPKSGVAKDTTNKSKQQVIKKLQNQKTNMAERKEESLASKDLPVEEKEASDEKEETCQEGKSEEPLASICEESTVANSTTTAAEDEEEEDDDYFRDVGFMFEENQPTRLETFEWKCPGGKTITVALHVADDGPAGAAAMQSGHYLWPAARTLAEFLVNKVQPQSNSIDIQSVVELGAGCALASLTALQLWQDTLQCVVVTDHDSGTLVRACDNLETTLQHIVDSVDEDKSDVDDDALNAAINSIASIPVDFEALEWGDAEAAMKVQDAIQEHTSAVAVSRDDVPPSMLSSSKSLNSIAVDLVLGSDLISGADVVEPLLQTAAQLMGHTGRFWLAQSVAYDTAIEAELDRVCSELLLQRTTICEEKSESDGEKRILQFVALSEE